MLNEENAPNDKISEVMPPSNPPSERLFFKDAVKYLKISSSSLRYLVTEKKIPVYRPTKKLQFKISDLDKWLETQRVEQVNE